MRTPCKGCTSRHERCHSECEKYLAFKERVAAANAAAERERVLNNYSVAKAVRSENRKQSILRK